LPQPFDKLATPQYPIIKVRALVLVATCFSAPAKTATNQLGSPALFYPVGDKPPVLFTTRRKTLAEKQQYLVDHLTGKISLSHQNGMAAPGIIIESFQVGNNFSAQRIEMDVADKFEKIGIFLANNGFVPILEKMTATLVPMVEIHGIACQKASHKDGKLRPVAAQKGVDVISQ
jgi:hypothetical protein